jgi:hypothetical protein
LKIVENGKLKILISSSMELRKLKMTKAKCKTCNCQCHCSVVNHSDILGICPCQACACDSKGVTIDDTEECETCQ